MDCPYCYQKAVKNGKDRRQGGTLIQTYRCKACSKRFNEWSCPTEVWDK